VIEARGLSKSYGKVVALDGLDLEVAAGELYGFIGPNGAGKTTTIHILATLLEGLDPRPERSAEATTDADDVLVVAAGDFRD